MEGPQACLIIWRGGTLALALAVPEASGMSEVPGGQEAGRRHAIGVVMAAEAEKSEEATGMAEESEMMTGSHGETEIRIFEMTENIGIEGIQGTAESTAESTVIKVTMIVIVHDHKSRAPRDA